VSKIIDTYRTRAECERYSHKATFEEIEANGFNLNIPRYVDTFEPEPEVDLQAVQNEIHNLENQLAQTREKMNFYLRELGINV
jgi:type I restriction enzyme M protein